MLAHSKSTMRDLRMLMHASEGHVTLLPGKFSSPSEFPQIGLTTPGGLTLGSAPNF